jgi:hypothetical protein
MMGKFLDVAVGSIELDPCETRLLKLHQRIDRDLLKSCFLKEQSQDNLKLCIHNVKAYIAKHYFNLIGVCKSINEDHPISKLGDCMPLIIRCLEYDICSNVKFLGDHTSSDDCVIS